MALRPETMPVETSPVDAGPAWPLTTLTPGPQAGAGGVWPTVDLTEAAGPGVLAPERGGHPGPSSLPPSPDEPPARRPAATRGGGASLHTRSLGELVGGAIAVGFVFVLAASVVSAFAHIPGQGVRARLLVAFNYSNFLTAVALLLGMVCLLLLGRSAARGGLVPASSGSPARPPAKVKEVLAATLAAESAVVGLGSLVSFVLYLSLAGSLPDAGVGHMLAELAVLPVVAVTLLWGWAGGTAKLRALFGVGTSAAEAEKSSAAGPLGPPPVVGAARDRQL